MQRFPIMNPVFRHRAWTLYKKQFKSVVGVAALAELLTLAVSLVAEFFIQSPIVYETLTLLSIGITMFLSIGLYQMAKHAWHEEQFDRLCLFQHFGRFGRALGITILITLPTILYAVIIGGLLVITLLLGNTDASLALAIFVLPVIIPLSILTVYFQYRLTMAYSVFVLNPETRAMDCVRTAWRSSKGFAGRLFCHNFVLSLPLLGGNLIISSMFVSAPIIALCLSSALSILYSGYFYIATFALEEYLLTGETSCTAPACPTSAYPTPYPPAEEEAESSDDREAAIAALYPPENPEESEEKPKKEDWDE